MKIIVFLAAATMAAGFAQTQAKQAPKAAPAEKVNNSRSNIKNNISVAPDGSWKCTGPEGKPCTEAQVKQLMSAMNASKAGIKTLTLVKPDGTLACEGSDGKPCTKAHLDALNAALPAAMRAVTSKGVSK